MARTPEQIEADFAAAAPHSPLGHRLMFVLLVLLAFALFAPAVLLPKLRQYGELLQEEQTIRRRVAQLNDEVRQRAELADSFANDTVVNERLAVLDLGYRKPNEEVFSVTADDPIVGSELPPADTKPPRSALLLPEDCPPWAIDLEKWGNQKGVIDLFLDPGLRPVFLLMSGGLLVAAFVLFAPRVCRPTPPVIATPRAPAPSSTIGHIAG